MQQLVEYRVYSINWTYSSLRMSKRPHFYGNFILANYLLLDNRTWLFETIVY